MNKQLGAIALIAGTAIGSGMIALPMTLAKLGIIQSFILMISLWALVYYTALVSVELNLQSGYGATLGELGKKYSGPGAQFIGVLSLKVLSYSLLTAYIYGGASIFHTAFIKANIDFTFQQIAIIYSAISVLILSFPLKSIDYINRILFVTLLSIVGLLILGLFTSLKWDDLPLWGSDDFSVGSLSILTPVVFTSFGFQVIFHTLTDYCKSNPAMLKRAFFWGSLLPIIIYFLWTFSILGVIYHNNKLFFEAIVSGEVDIGYMIKELSSISASKSIQVISWWISVLAIFTSVIGVGLGLTGSWDHIREQRKHKITTWSSHFVSVLLSIVPALIIAILIPKAFINILAFAGMILVIIAILQPMYLLYKGNFKKLHYPILKYSLYRILAILAGLLIIIFECLNIFS